MQNAEQKTSTAKTKIKTQGAGIGCDLAVAFIVVLLDFVIWGLTISWVPNMFGIKTGATTYGIVQSGYTLINLASAPLMGKISDLYGRTSIVLVSQFMRGVVIIAMVYFAPFLENSEEGLFSLLNCVVFLSCFRGFNHTFTVVKALVGDLSESDNRRWSMSLLYAVVGFGFAAGSGCAMLFAEMETRMQVTCIVCVVATLISYVGWHLSRSSAEEKGREKRKFRHINLILAGQKACKDKAILILLVADLLLSVSYKSFTSVMSSFCQDKLGLEGAEFSRAFAIIGVAYTIVQATITPAWSKRMSEMRMAHYAMLLLALARFLLGFASSELELHLYYLLVHIGSGAADVTVTALITKCAGPEETGFILGVADSCRGFVGVFIPAAIGYAFDLYGPHVASGVSASAALCGFLVLRSFTEPVTARLKERKAQEEQVVTAKDKQD